MNKEKDIVQTNINIKKLIISAVGTIVTSGAILGAVAYWIMGEVDIRKAQREYEIEMERKQEIDSVQFLAEAYKAAIAQIEIIKLLDGMEELMTDIDAERVYISYLHNGGSNFETRSLRHIDIVEEVTVEGISPIQQDWENKLVPPGLSRFLARNQIERFVYVTDTDTDKDLSGNIIVRYLRAYGTRSLMSIYLGQAPDNSGHYYLTASYYNNHMDSSQRDYQEVRMDVVADVVRRFYDLQEVDYIKHGREE